MIAKQQRTPIIPKLSLHSKVGVIWQPSEKPAVKYLRNYFNQHGAIFRDYCIFDSDSNPATEANSLTINDLNWWGIPKPEKVSDFIEMKLDLLLCLASEKNYAVDYITALSHAKFKIGSSETDNSYFDLNIKIGQNKDTMFLAQQQIFYLAQLNNTTDS
ncbi:hypothetical protein G0Q07_09725 [Draconibacterium halophilum]|uniref:Uncharacterized protein n=1 Tax=Draconibacterium halophilum TaxID=2706887 RepID=A0A6C0RBG4_9BACT|nr:hypothetical protein [Draconibacterium halophilum]QIA07988.1 hypothetical protein G0Q07_09725 [Draconibacterium halophilum]